MSLSGRCCVTLLIASLVCCSVVCGQSGCSPTVVEVVVSSQSGTTAAERSAGQSGHYDTPTSLFVSPGDVLVYNGAVTNSWCYNTNTSASCSNAQGFAPNGPASFGILTMALAFRYGNTSVVSNTDNADWAAVFPYTAASGTSWQSGTPQQYTWTVPIAVTPLSEVWLAVWDTDVADNSGSAAVAITQTLAGCPTTCSSAAASIVVAASSTATAAERSAGQSGHSDTPTGLFVNPGDVLTYTGALVNSWCYNTNTSASCSNAQGFALNGPASFGILTMALAFRYGNVSSDAVNSNWYPVFPFSSGISWVVGSVQQFAWTVPLSVPVHSQLWLAVWDTIGWDNTGQAAVAITRTSSTCNRPCTATVVEVSVVGSSTATAGERAAWQSGHYDTPTGLFVSPGDVLTYSGAAANSWCYNTNLTTSCSNAQGFAPNGAAPFGILSMALAFRYGNNAAEPRNASWAAVFPYSSGNTWVVGVPQQYTWTVPADLAPLSQVWLAAWDTYQYDNTGSANVAISRLPASCPATCTQQPALSVVVQSASTATASERAAGNSGHYDTPTGVFVIPGDVLTVTSAATSSWCYNTNVPTSCSNAQGYVPNGIASYGIRTIALAFRYGNNTTDAANTSWSAVFPYLSGNTWRPGYTQQSTLTVPIGVPAGSQLWMATWDTWQYDNTGFSAVSITRTPATCFPLGGVRGDPQFKGLRGQDYQVHGVDGGVYNIISESDVQLNSQFVFLNGPRPCPIMPSTGKPSEACFAHAGSYLGNLALLTAAGDRLLIESGEAADGFSSVALNGQQLQVGDIAVLRACSGLHGSIVVLNSHELRLHAGLFSMQLENSDSFLNLVRISARSSMRVLEESGVHGLLGQTWRLRTGRSAIEGKVDDYLLDSEDLFGTDFLFNRFQPYPTCKE